MNWKKLLSFIIAAPAVAAGGAILNNPSAPVNLHTVGIPALAALLSTLTALFVQPPHTDGK